MTGSWITFVIWQTGDQRRVRSAGGHGHADDHSADAAHHQRGDQHRRIPYRVARLPAACEPTAMAAIGTRNASPVASAS